MVKKIIFALSALLLLAQLLPYGKPSEPLPTTQEAPWPSQEAKALAQRACYDCHSNQARWPWYAHVAPVSWWITHHVDEGRSKINFSTWDQPQKDLDELVEVLEKGEMPLWSYTLAHAEARLTDAEKAVLMQALKDVAAKRL